MTEKMMEAVRVHEPGEAEVLQLEELPLPEPGPAEVRVRLLAAGVNFIDIYHRRGLYELPTPFILGREGAGYVDAVGEDVTDLQVGDRVAFAMQPAAYAGYVTMPAWKLAPVPEGVNLETAAGVMLQGMTAHYLAHSTYPLQPGKTALIHAAAGGVGLLLVQIAKMRGARVIGTTSTPEKGELAREAGADEIILYEDVDFGDAVHDLTDGEGVHVVYDGVGRTTFRRGLDCLRPRGFMVLFGQASGPVEPLDPQILNHKGSLFLTRPSLGDYAATGAEIRARARDLFSWIAAGDLQVRIDRAFSLDAADEAHRYMEERQTKGKLLLLPQGHADALKPSETIDLEDPVDEAGWESFPASDPPPY